MTRVLFVDDDALVLSGLRRVLARERNRWEMHFALGAGEALAALDAQPFDVIVTDMQMPGYDGATLLAEVQHQYPDLCRVVLSGECNANQATSVANTAQAYLTKPCEVETIVATITRLLDVREAAPTRTRSLVGAVTSLPSPPTILQELSAALTHAEPDPRRIAHIIESDVAIAAKVLQLANSAFYGMAGRVTSVDAAVNYMGVNTIKDLASAAAVFRSFESDPLTRAVVRRVEAHSNSTAVTAVELAPRELRQTAHVAALLHDVGLLVLAQSCATEADRPDLDPDHPIDPEFETAYFGTTHAEVGAYLLSLWGLPEELCEAVRHHHDESIPAGDTLTLTHITHIAVALQSHLLGHPIEIDESRLADLGIAETVQRILEGQPAT